MFQTMVNGKLTWCASMSGYDRNDLDANGKPKRWFVRGFGATPQEAMRRRHANLMKRAAKGDGNVVRQARSVRLSAYLETWLASYGPESISDEVRRKYRRDIEHHVLRHLDKPMRALTTDDLRTLFYETLPPIATPSARWNAYRTLRTLFSHAVKHGVISVSPLVGVDLPKRETAVRKDDEQLISQRVDSSKRMLARLKDPDSPLHEHYPRILTMFLGLRRAEILGLTWDCFNHLQTPGEASVIVRQQLKRHEDGSGWFIYPRTKNGRDRIVPLPETWRLAILEEQAKGRVANEDWASDLVFLTPKGRHVDYNTHAAGWKAVLAAYGGSEEGALTEAEYFRGHAARHVTASMLFEQGVPLEMAQEILGHSDRAITLYYTHITKAARRRAVADLEDGLIG